MPTSRIPRRFPRFPRAARAVRRLGVKLLAAGFLVVIAGCWPVTETLDGPRRAVLRSSVPDLELGVNATWYEYRMDPRTHRRRLDFGPDATVELPDYRLQTTAGLLLAKRLFGSLAFWSECECCYGPTAYAGLYRINDYRPPDKFRLVQNAREVGNTLVFEASLIPDESKFEERPLAVRDLDALLAECRALLQAGARPNIPREDYGPELRGLNPVRAEAYRDTVLVWMGGRVGYTLNPSGPGGPLVNGAWTSATEYPGIHRIERIRDD